ILVDEGDIVKEGQLIAVIDPKETRLRVDQDRANVRGARASASRQQVEFEQKKVTSRAAYRQALARLAELELQFKAQPELTAASIQQAKAGRDSAVQERDRLANFAQPNQRIAYESAVREAEANVRAAELEHERQVGLRSKGYSPEKAVEVAHQQFEVAQARLSTARDQLERLGGQQKAELARADEAVAQAQAQLRQATENAFQSAASRQQYLSALADVDRMRTGLRDVETAQKTWEQGRAQVDQLSSVLSDSERQLGETEIRAPMSGIVTKKLTQEGELVASLSSFSAGTPIVRIEDRRGMRLKMDVNEIDVARLKLGMTADIAVDALPDLSFKGKVKKISPASNPAQTGVQDPVVKYQVELEIASPDRRLRSGMSAKCTLEVSHGPNVLQLPVEYVVKEGSHHYVTPATTKPLAKDAKPERVEVKTGIETGSAIEILSGAKEGLKVQRPEYTGPTRKGMMQMGPD
ncbi:MAG: efflux RND transporter periplasmic adaptor subunit, partial [Fimbriimonas ginsengisoli]|nr:efflux RND transporter periplasmic adaptor subunit [Fimbriimonas ginsengisoli]